MGNLYTVATPIGNLEDITFRAINILKEVNLIACEDTRHTLKLLNHYDISKPLISYHQHSKVSKIDHLIEELKAGKDIAIVTDAGTPGISDPGQVLISKAVEKGIRVIPIPGPSAVIAALSAAGVPTDAFIFLGFLPLKKGRKRIIESFKDEKRTIVLYESPHRIEKLLGELKDVLEDRKIVVARELTKMFEEIIRGTVSEVQERLKIIKGEFVVIVSAK
ncbi:16S rRNA (cytidine(1402)-2'-O)-methyltransferase [Patescibacteria group bacterium]|nr:16S rRNA (cytidine(1402)-2'-O)-methyltransferase [Patescibacteria group bacterium]MBU1952338.1 16S rRNA (cytidine(1402)-2'-O)-methyltransferase [Patescibacteria group bacterium]